MKRKVWGIILVVLGILIVISAGRNQERFVKAIVIGLLCVAGGSLMYYLGKRYLSQKKAVAEIALQMLRDENKINAGSIAQRLGVSEVDVRQYITDAQHKSTIPMKVEIK